MWGGSFGSYLQMRATVACGPDITGVPSQAALAGHAAELGTLASLILCIAWYRQRRKSGTGLFWIVLTLLALIAVILLALAVVGISVDLDPAGYIPSCGHGP
ncbi:MAG: hypothetical protein J2P25_05155 [Nocardiopsaceae bacterium]|nr:hypothetical protein [Nocardiopsaceae bacterium]